MYVCTENRAINVFKLRNTLYVDSSELQLIQFCYQNHDDDPDIDYWMDVYCYISKKEIRENGGIKKMIVERVKEVFGDTEVRFVKSTF